MLICHPTHPLICHESSPRLPFREAYIVCLCVCVCVGGGGGGGGTVATETVGQYSDYVVM